MLNDRYVFSQLIDSLPKYEFNRCVARYHGNQRIRSFSCFDQFLCMAFAQLTYRESLRDIEICLHAFHKKLYHAGFRGVIARSTLANANELRDWRIYEDFAHVLIARARKLYLADSFGIELEQPAYALDSTTIDLCLTLFPWAHFRRHKAALKLHTLIDFSPESGLTLDLAGKLLEYSRGSVPTLREIALRFFRRDITVRVPRDERAIERQINLIVRHTLGPQARIWEEMMVFPPCQI